MTQASSLRRIIYLTLLCLIFFPTLFETGKYYKDLKNRDLIISSKTFLGEMELVKRHIDKYINSHDQWPKSLKQAGYLSDEHYLSFDLSNQWVMKASIKNHPVTDHRVYYKHIVLRYNPQISRWECDFNLSNLSDQYTHQLCKTTNPSSRLSAENWNVLIILGTLFIALVLYLFKHPLLEVIRKNDGLLNTTDFNQLKKMKRLAGVSRTHSGIMQVNQLSKQDWAYLHQETPKDWLRTLTQNLPIDTAAVRNHKHLTFSLSNQFELNVSAFNVYVANKTDTISRIIRKVNEPGDKYTPVLLLVADPDTQAETNAKLKQFKPPVIIPNPLQLTQLKLPGFSQKCLIKLFRKHLPLTTISPYQGKGGVIKPSHFFGRQGMLEDLVSNVNSNFFIVGGRQLGKTSLLKALMHELQNNKNHYCQYVSLSDERLLPRLKYLAKDNSVTSLRSAILSLQKQHPSQTIRLLIDEADQFIRKDAKNGYMQLNEIRQCSEEGLCQFIFAGFWELYAHAILDYHSPLRNFANSIIVAGLELDAAIRLVIGPLHLLGLRLSHERLAQKIVEKCGQRANLINLICEDLVKQVSVTKKMITPSHVDESFKCQNVQDALQGWSSLTSKPEDSQWDRVIVYLVFIHASITLKQIQKTAGKHGLKLSAEKIKQSIQRLQLAHILKKEQEHHQFAVPLFADQYSAQEAEVLLQQELANWHS